ncbi:unnamed protein product, partial [Oppiella nova]
MAKRTDRYIPFLLNRILVKIKGSQEFDPQIESQLKNKHELNKQLNESFKNISINKEYLQKPLKRVESNLESDTVSIQSQMSFQDELSATIKSRKSVAKTSVIKSDGNKDKEMNGETKSEDKKKDDKNKELNLAMMVEHLHRKNFHPRLISK